MNSYGFKGARAVCVALLALVVTGCASLVANIEPPTVKLVSLQLIEAGFLEQRYGIKLRVNNPNSITLPIKGVSYAVRLAGVDFASGQTPRAFRIEGYGDSEVDLEVSTNLLDSVVRLRDWLNGSPTALDYELTGKVQVDLPFVGAVPFSEIGSIDLRSGK